MTVILFIFFGLAIGSFLNVLILRLPIEQSIRGRSHCASCKKDLVWFELIPILSFLIQKRRCRSCGTVFSWQYPIIELITGALFALLFVLLQQYYTFDLTFFILLALGLLAITTAIFVFVVDLYHLIIPNGSVLILLIIGITFSLIRTYNASADTSIFYDAGTALLIALFFAALWFFSGGKWMGLGDAKLILATSLILGTPSSIIALLFAFWLGGIVAATLLLTGRRALGSHIPFGPFILLGTAIALLFGEHLLVLTGLTYIL